MSRRTERLGSIIRQELMAVIQRELNDPRLTGLPAITRVKVTEDLAYADVFVTVMGEAGHREAALNALKHSAGLMRSKLTKVLALRTAPFLRFQFDEQLRKELEVLELIEQVARESREQDARRAAADGQATSPPPTGAP
jgi:ribosome-binding factor A